jgi:putative heme-binding domain-containing protein
VAPNLAALTDRSAKALLIAIMDPNQAVEDKYVDYIVVTNDGRTFRGMMGLETDTHVVLHAGDNKQFTIPRSDIEELVSSGRSLMPDGFERQVDQQQLADLITYLQRTRSAPKSFEGNKPKIPILRDDGSARLLATDCRIYGPTLVFESQYRNLGFWGSEQDTAIWTVRLQHAGKYRVVLDYACAADTAGNRFRLEANGQVLTGKIQGTGTWDNYRTSTIGVFDLPAGEFEVTLRSDGPLQSYLMDLHGVILRPQ